MSAPAPGPGADPDRRRRLVLAVARLVPAGRVVSYGDIAELCGLGPREVGRVMATGPAPGEPEVPWWRVTNASGDLPPHLREEAVARYRQEGVRVREGGGAAIRTHRADLPALADAAEAQLGPLPGTGTDVEPGRGERRTAPSGPAHGGAGRPASRGRPARGR